MTFDKRLELACRCFSLQGILAELPFDFPTLRELRIQNAKLQRMLLPTSLRSPQKQ
jgi:hypothetical protein